MSVLLDHFDLITRGLLLTITLNMASLTLGFATGAGLGLLMHLGPAPLRVLARSYVEVIRNTPFLIQAMVLFAAVGAFGVRLPPIVLGGIALSLYTTAYMAELTRAALASFPAGQMHAGAALGLRPGQTLRRIAVPQILPILLPAGTNLAATLIKESAVLSALAVADLTFAGQVIIGQTYATAPVWTAVAGLYWLIVTALSTLAAVWEEQLNRHHRIVPS